MIESHVGGGDNHLQTSSHLWDSEPTAGWWFGACLGFFHILGIIPTDEYFSARQFPPPSPEVSAPKGETFHFEGCREDAGCGRALASSHWGFHLNGGYPIAGWFIAWKILVRIISWKIPIEDMDDDLGEALWMTSAG